MLLPVALLVFGLIGSLVVLWKKNTEAGANDGHETPFPAPVQLAAGWFSSARRPVLALAGGAAAGGHAGDTPGWRGIGMPDGFSVWHHLDANGIRFKSITPQKDGLLIKFDSTARGAAAKEVLGRALPHGYIIALLEDDNSPTARLSRLRDAPHRLG